MAKWKDSKTYWDYTIDDYSNHDIPSFIEKIHETKLQELKSIYYKDSSLNEEEITEEIKSKLTITYVGHSMGGMVLPMYVINRRIKNKPHYLSSAILLSPAGIHTNSSF